MNYQLKIKLYGMMRCTMLAHVVRRTKEEINGNTFNENS